MRIFKYIIAIFVLSAHLSFAQTPAQVFDLIEKKEWLKALEAAQQTPQAKILIKIVLTQQFLDPNATNATFSNAIQFVKQNPNWLHNKAIIKQAEHNIDQGTDLKAVYNWFSHHASTTTNGHKYYALAAAQFSTDQNQKANLIKKGWIKGKFSDEEYEEYLHKFQQVLNLNDHKAKIENLLWHGNTQQATKLLALIDLSHQSFYQAWLKILANDPKVDEIFNNLPKNSQYHPGLLYAYLAYKKTTPKKISLNLEELLTHAKNDVEHEQQWTKLRIYYTRELLEQKMYHNAYQIIAKHHSKDPSLLSEAEWLAGWISLRFLNEPTRAMTHFLAVNKVVRRPISIAKISYWLGKTCEAEGQIKESINWLKKAASYGQTFYGQVAMAELGIKKLILPKPTTILPATITTLNAQDSYQALKLVLKHANNQLALRYVETLADRATTPEEAMAVIEIANYFRRPFLIVSASRKTHKIFTPKSYPMPYKIKKNLIEAPLVYATIRQESSFNQYSVEAANDRGLMQIIPGTACETAKILKVPCDLNRLITDPYYNIAIGSRHLYDRINYYHGSYILGIASYNAGVQNVNRWLKIFGDPRKARSLIQLIDWLESIPFTHTRPYVQRVLENLAVYRFISGQQNLNILKDLFRGA